MVTVTVVGKTPDEEFDQVAQRAYEHISSESITKSKTQTELIHTLDNEYFQGKAVPILLTKVGEAFKRKGWWVEEKIVAPFPEMPEVKMPPKVTEKPLIEYEKYKKPKVVKAKKGKRAVKAPVEYDAEYAVNYVNARPSRAKKGQIYKVTKRRKLLKRTVYIKRINNLMKGWTRKRQPH